VWVPSLGEELENCCGCVSEGAVEGCTSVCCDSTGVYCGDETGCYGSCCVDGVCADEFQADCAGVWNSGTCELTGCPVACCEELADGNPSCNEFSFTAQCNSPSVEGADCDTACLGECCDADGVSLGQQTQSECNALDGYWAGVGSTSCQDVDECRSPFTPECCESKQSSGAGLTFTQPRNKRTPPFDGTLMATATGTTDSPILIHGIPVGKVGKRCPFNVSFLLCGDSFNIEPVPCGSNFHKVDVTVCWDEAPVTAETLNFSGCNGLTVWLGNCQESCVTTLSYTGAGATSNASIFLLGDGVIAANGTGPLVLTANITHSGSCDRKLTLTGTSTAANELSGEIQNGPSDTDVEKTGVGLWRLSGNSPYAGQLKVLNGTLVIAAGVNELGSSPFGDSSAPRPVIGNSAAGATGTAAMLVLGGVLTDTSGSIDRTFSVAALGSGASQVVVLGTTGTGDAVIGTASTDIRLGRSVTLQASDNSTAIFLGRWRDFNGNTNPVVGYTIGSVGNAGVVRLRSILSGSATGVDIVNGTAQVANTDVINVNTPVTIQGAVLDIKAQSGSISQRLGTITFTGGPGTIESSDNSGTLRLDSGSTATVTVSGTGHEISLPVELLVNSTFNVGGDLEVSGNVSGSGNLTKSGSGTLELSGAISYTGTTDIQAGTLIVNQEFAGSADISDVTFTPTTLTVAFTTTPTSGATYQLLGGATTQTYGTVTLTGAGGATATYNAANSTLTIN